MKEFIEKLIGRLEERKQLHNRVIAYEQKSGTVAEEFQQRKAVEVLDDVIKIVNQLAEEYNNDFCEWFKYDYRTIAPKNHDAENPYWRIPENWDKLKFCPYCGKKIKVVE